MKGPITVRTTSKRLQYDFTLSRKYTIIKGDSATGKTTLYTEVQRYVSGDPSVTVKSPYPLVPASDLGRNWARALAETHNAIVFIDEDSTWVRSVEFAREAQASDNFYVLINRDPLPEIPYSYKEVYEIHSSGKFHTLRPLYDTSHDTFTPDYILTEDSQAGYQFFRHVCSKAPDNCLAASGKSNIYGMLLTAPLLGAHVLVIADGAAFGCDIERVLALQGYRDGAVGLFLPESFEQLLLTSPMFESDIDVQEVLCHTSAFVDVSVNSWEQFFTDYLTRITATAVPYTKRHLSPCYVANCCFKNTPCRLYTSANKVAAILRNIPNVDFSNLRDGGEL